MIGIDTGGRLEARWSPATVKQLTIHRKFFE